MAKRKTAKKSRLPKLPSVPSARLEKTANFLSILNAGIGIGVSAFALHAMSKSK